VAQRRNIDVGERPLTGRSVVASVLLGMGRPELSGQRLVRTAELFGLSEGTTRVALSRMVNAGELTTAEGRYGLAGPLLVRHARQGASRHPVVRDWHGGWLLAVAGGSSRPAGERVELRRTLARLRLAEWREGVWTRPDNLAGEMPDLGGCTWLLASLVAAERAAALVGGLWDLDGWASRARQLHDQMAATIDGLRNGETDGLAPCFVTAAATVRHIAADPLLPPSLLPAEWPGADFRAAYDAYEAAYQALLRTWLAGLDR
jgi:phenylacetic acid degradation operon negative regulatory protein